uniref:Enhancer of mRNA-decapping protein 4 WD40 repeat region domain-containing protein n=1 Tax=Mucochytrium quahogii TaxID=96639 RepID=A0A7S2SCV0_9STRA
MSGDKVNQLNRLFPGLANGPPQLGGTPPPAHQQRNASVDADPNGPPELSPAQLHFQRLLAGKSPTNHNSNGTEAVQVDAAKEESEQEDEMIREELAIRETSTHTLPNTMITIVKNDQSQYICGSRVASSGDFINYMVKSGPKSGVKSGTVRVIHAASVKTALLRGHSSPITDMKFCPKHSGLVATVAADGFAIVWELRYEPTQDKVLFREAVRLRVPSGQPSFSRVDWHPQNERLFVLCNGDQVSLVELTGQLWSRQQESKEQGIPVDDARCGLARAQGVQSVSFSNNGAKMLVASEGGLVHCFNTETPSGELNELWSFSAHNGEKVLSAQFVDQIGNVLLTIGDNNSAMRLWNCQSSSNFTPVHELRLVGGSGRYLAALSSSKEYLFIADIGHPSLICVQMDFAPPRFGPSKQYQLDSPILSFSTRMTPEGMEEIICVQTEAIQYFTFDPQVFVGTEREQCVSKTLERSDSGLVTPAQLLNQPPRENVRPTQQQPQLMVPMGNSTPPQPANKKKNKKNGRKAETPPVSTSVPETVPNMTVEPASYTTAAQASPVPSAVPLVTGHAQTSDLDTVIQKHMDSLYEKIRLENEARTQKDLARQKSLLQVLSKSLNEIPDNVEEAVREALEDETVVQSMASAMSESLSGIIGTAVLETLQVTSRDKLNESIDGIADKVVERVRKPVQNAFAQTFRDSLVPAFEAGCNNMISQYQKASPNAGGDTAQVEAMGQQIETLTHQITQMQTSMARLLSAMTQPAPNVMRKRGISAPPAVFESVELSPKYQEILGLIQRGDYNGAFLMALSASDLNLVVSTCKALDPEMVFSSVNALSPNIMLSLMQQLSVDLGKDAPLKLQWMQRAGVALDPKDKELGGQTENVMQSILTNMQNQRSFFEGGTGADPNRSLYEMCLNIVKSRTGLYYS